MRNFHVLIDYTHFFFVKVHIHLLETKMSAFFRLRPVLMIQCYSFLSSVISASYKSFLTSSRKLKINIHFYIWQENT